MENLELIVAHHVDQERRGLLPTSIEKRDGQLQIFARYLEPRSLLDAQREDVEQFLDSRNIGARTRYAWLSHLHNFYDWTLREDIGTSDPTVRIIRPKMRRSLPRPAATDQLAGALRVADPLRRCWLLLAAYMGLRCQEIAGIRREDILQDEGLLRVVKGKGGVERMIPIHPEVMAALLALPMPGVGWVFLRPGGGPWPPPYLSQRFNKFLREAGVNGTAHTLRHWFGSNLYAQSHDIRLTQEMLGHARLETTAIYTAFDRRAAGDAIRSMSFTGGSQDAPALRLLPPAS
jgi:integrase/recombinase XerD